MSDLKKDLAIDEWLEIIKEDKNLYGAYIPIAQYLYLIEQENQQLKEQLEAKTLDWEIACGHNEELKNIELKERKQLQQKDEVIREAIEFIKEFHNYQNRFKWCEDDYIDTIEELEKILNKYSVG